MSKMRPKDQFLNALSFLEEKRNFVLKYEFLVGRIRFELLIDLDISVWIISDLASDWPMVTF